MRSITHLRLFSHALFVLSILLNMEGLFIAAVAIGFKTAVLYVFKTFDEYRQLTATKELHSLLAKADALRTTLYWTTTSVENALRRNLVAFKHIAKMFNNAVHRICGETDHTSTKEQ